MPLSECRAFVVSWCIDITDGERTDPEQWTNYTDCKVQTCDKITGSALPAGPAWLWSVWKSSGRNLLFWKDAAPVPGTTPRSCWSSQSQTLRPRPAWLHLGSMVSRLNQLRHKYFSISHHSDFFLIKYYFIFGYLTWCSRTIEFIFIPVEKHRRLVQFEYYFKYPSTP